MVYGPLEPHLKGIALSIASWMRTNGLSPPPESALISALLVTILTVIVGASFVATLTLFPSRNVRDAVLIVGPSPATTVAPAPGKTTLFHVLRTGHAPPFGTVPSQATNEGMFAPSASLFVADPESEEAEHPIVGPVQWMDFPGHARLRPLLSDHLVSARAIVFVLDSSPVSFARTLRESADLLHEILTHRVVAKRATPILLFCNKSDLPSPVQPSDVRSRLEAEIERARKAKAAALAGAQNAVVSGHDAERSRDDDDLPVLGFDNEDFKFDHVRNNVTIATGSAKQRDVSAVCSFVADQF
jgi:signal recognition particle receptor subunit beta